MTERLHATPAYAQRLFDYFLSNPNDAETRAEYIRRGLIPTNNLSLFIVDEPAEELAPGTGIDNPFNYRSKPFGHLIEALKIGNPNLWEQAKELTTASNNLVDRYQQIAFANQSVDGAEAQAIAAQLEIAIWEKAEVCTQVVQILGPQFDTEGLDIIELCG